MCKFFCENLMRRIKKTALEVNRLGGRVLDFKIEDPATKEEIKIIEENLGFNLPVHLKDFLLSFSKSIIFSYSLDNMKKVIPSQLKSIFAGSLYIDLNEIYTINEDKNYLIDNCFDDLDKELITKLRNTLAFLTVPNGDYLAIDLNEEYPTVIYISHELDEMNGCILGDNFLDFIDRLSKICFIGPEDFQFKNFIVDTNKGLYPCAENAFILRDLFNFNVESVDNDSSLDSYTIEIQTYDMIEDMLGDTWERKYIIKTQDTLTKEIHEMTIPAINGGILTKEMFQGHDNYTLISFEEIVNIK